MVHQPALSALLGPIALLTPVPAQSVAQAASHLDQPLPAQHVHQAPIPIMQGPALVQCAPCAKQGRILSWVPLSALHASQAATQVQQPLHAPAAW